MIAAVAQADDNFAIDSARWRGDITIAGAVEAFGPITRYRLIHRIELVDGPKMPGRRQAEVEIVTALDKSILWPHSTWPQPLLWISNQNDVESGAVFPHPRHREQATTVSR